jgi:hypothetical protein
MTSSPPPLDVRTKTTYDPYYLNLNLYLEELTGEKLKKRGMN